MKKNILTIMVMAMALSGSLTAYASETTVTVSPATETTINGIPESEYNNYQTRDVIARTFYSYKNNVTGKVDNFKLCASFRHDNTLSPNAATMRGQVTRSEAQGSEWEFSGHIGGEFKVPILAKAEAQAGASYKMQRSKNEAVGYEVEMTVPAYKVGYLDLYYSGRKIGGVATYKQFNTANPSNYIFVKEDVNATVYNADSLEVSSKSRYGNT